jgi:hypothetical protein
MVSGIEGVFSQTALVGKKLCKPVVARHSGLFCLKVRYYVDG